MKTNKVIKNAIRKSLFLSLGLLLSACSLPTAHLYQGSDATITPEFIAQLEERGYRVVIETQNQPNFNISYPLVVYGATTDPQPAIEAIAIHYAHPSQRLVATGKHSFSPDHIGIYLSPYQPSAQQHQYSGLCGDYFVLVNLADNENAAELEIERETEAGPFERLLRASFGIANEAPGRFVMDTGQTALIQRAGYQLVPFEKLLFDAQLERDAISQCRLSFRYSF